MPGEAGGDTHHRLLDAVIDDGMSVSKPLHA